MTYIEAPTEYTGDAPAVFLAGGITDCPDWQAEARRRLNRADIAVLNPRRANFPIHDPSAAEAQIDWEYRHLQRADVVLFWFPEGPAVQPIAVGCSSGYLRSNDIHYQIKLVRPELTIHHSLIDTCRAAADLLTMSSLVRSLSPEAHP